jgi:hypothetical protein
MPMGQIGTFQDELEKEPFTLSLTHYKKYFTCKMMKTSSSSTYFCHQEVSLLEGHFKVEVRTN